MKSNMKRWVVALITAGAAMLSACGGSDHENEALDIVSLAKSNTNLSVLGEAIEAAGLETTLRGAGPFTVFAPTNEAFTALLSDLNLTKAQLLADKALLTSVLTYHVLGSKVVSTAVPLGQPITTLQKGIFKAEASGGSLKITDGRNRVSNVVTADVGAQNGVVHIIDKVLLPADKNVVQTAIALSTAPQPQFTILVEAIVAADLQNTLSGAGPFTVFAPTDAAFAALLTELSITKEALLANKTLLTKVLTYHVVPGLVLKAQVPVGSAITTVQGETFTVNAALAITDQRSRSANIISTDVLTSNGVIHVIDKVILPQP
ncbi:fasciclin domain-containing protein [Limnohabitans sp.]|uniref:fasciclin domain-containing protein n=1 Tax=Limnohabitans sp. TaxID=1907725 RepID=UPI0037BFB8D1